MLVGDKCDGEEKSREWGAEDASTVRVTVLQSMVREGFCEMLMFEQSHAEIR